MNVAPLPSSLSTLMAPPCSSTSWCTMLSPRPVPPFTPETEEEKREYAAALDRRRIRLSRA